MSRFVQVGLTISFSPGHEPDFFLTVGYPVADNRYYWYHYLLLPVKRSSTTTIPGPAAGDSSAMTYTITISVLRYQESKLDVRPRTPR